MNNMEISKSRMVSYISLLMILCIVSFLFAKYMVRANIRQNDIPIDTSVRLK